MNIVSKQVRALFETAMTGFLALAALGMASIYVRDRVRSGPATVVVEDWQQMNDEGIWRGPLDASVVISEFVDFQCPYCRDVAPTVDSILAANPDNVAFVFHHYPLDLHPDAESAAVAAECAHQQDRFAEFAQTVFARQHELPQRPWLAFAGDAGVADLDAFETCSSLGADSFPRIARGLEIGARAGVQGTPTFWVNGKVTYSMTLASEVLAALDRR